VFVFRKGRNQLHLFYVSLKMEGTIEWYSMLKHVHHIRHIRHIPITDIGWLNAVAQENEDCMVVTLPTFQALIPSLNFLFPSNSPFMLVTWDTSHLLMCPYFSSAAAGSKHHRLIAALMSPFLLDSLLSRYGRNILSMKAAVKHIREFLLCNSYKHSGMGCHLQGI
jgi:hypothetical protein